LTLIPASATVKQRRATERAALLSSRRLLFHRLGRRGINQLADRPNVIRDSPLPIAGVIRSASWTRHRLK
jgi:hypothetical protein